MFSDVELDAVKPEFTKFSRMCFSCSLLSMSSPFTHIYLPSIILHVYVPILTLFLMTRTLILLVVQTITDESDFGFRFENFISIFH